MALKGEAMLLYTKINNLPKPETFGVKSLVKWLKLNRYPIDGPGENSWGKLKTLDEDPPSLWSQFWKLVRTIFRENESDKLDLDLVVPRRNEQVDGLTRWVESEGVPFWERACVVWNKFWKPKKLAATLPPATSDTSSRRSSNASSSTFSRWLSDLRRKMSNASQVSENFEENDTGDGRVKIVTYHYKTLIAFTTFVTTVFASLLPVVAIVVLSKLHKQPMILGFIALFTGLFTMGLMILTPPGTKRTEIFTASAA
jgi:hypothetical protein